MSGNRAEMDLMVADTTQARKRFNITQHITHLAGINSLYFRWTTMNSEPYVGRPSRDMYRKFDW